MLASLLTVGQQIIILFILMAVGFVLGKVKMIDHRSSVVMSNVAMYAVTPAVLITAFQRDLVRDDLANFGQIVLVFTIVSAVAVTLSYLCLRGEAVERLRVFRFGVVFPNCGFMGYPLMTAILGPIGIFFGSACVVVFQLLAWTWGVFNMTGSAKALKLKPMLINPGVLAVAAAMGLYLLQIRLPEVVLTPLTHLGNMNTPLPMLIVGYQLSQADFRTALQGRNSWLAMGLRLVAMPLAALGLCLALHANPTVTVVVVASSSTPAAALTSMFAAKFEGNTALASSTVSVQTLCSILTMPVVIALAQYLVH